VEQASQNDNSNEQIISEDTVSLLFRIQKGPGDPPPAFPGDKVMFWNIWLQLTFLFLQFHHSPVHNIPHFPISYRNWPAPYPPSCLNALMYIPHLKENIINIKKL
jgi:hypothetical protein